jgi:hypothetical protein
MVSATPVNGTVGVMTAVVNLDPASHQLTWIGTNSGGAQSAGTTTPGNPNPNPNPQIADIAGGNYTLSAQAPGANTPNGSLVITYAASAIPAHPPVAGFVVTLIW